MVNVCSMVTRRDQDLDGLTQQFLAGIAEHLFRLTVDEHDSTICIDIDDRIGCRFQECLELGTTLEQGLFRTPALRPYVGLTVLFGREGQR